jgi:adenylosuccinate synthase
MTLRKNSIAFCGGAYGDEGKGRIVDEFVFTYAKKGKVIVYRDNGGANAGHTVEFKDGTRIALHQIPSGVFCKDATMILGKYMVLHPADLILEIDQVIKTTGKNNHAVIMIDEMALLCLDTHRALEAALKLWNDGGKTATGRGISPAYMDVILRQPLRMRNLKNWDESQIKKHYQLYQAIIKGLGLDLKTMSVPSLVADYKPLVGSESEFLTKLKVQAETLSPYIHDVHQFTTDTWKDPAYGFVFEKAQALGLDNRWGCYPDVSASDMTFDGITASTEGIIESENIKHKVAVIKATYMSSVGGGRQIPTLMHENALELRIRKDAHEYGATTKRTREISYLDLVSLKYFGRMGKVTAYALTHMDIVYPDTPIKVCVAYTINGKPAAYRPDQEYLLKVKPVYQEFEPWDQQEIQKAKTKKELPKNAVKFLNFLESYLEIPIMVITTGPKRNQSIKL